MLKDNVWDSSDEMGEIYISNIKMCQLYNTPVIQPIHTMWSMCEDRKTCRGQRFSESSIR
jgi:hypothetical protein